MSHTLETANTFLQQVHRDIPLTQAMQLAVSRYNGNELVLSVPLAPNINDKGTGFAGSISALANITGWMLLSLWSAKVFGPCRVAIADATFSFKKPIQSDFSAHVTLPDSEQCHLMREQLQGNGRCKVNLLITVEDDSGMAATVQARYVVWVE